VLELALGDPAAAWAALAEPASGARRARGASRSCSRRPSRRRSALGELERAEELLEPVCRAVRRDRVWRSRGAAAARRCCSPRAATCRRAHSEPSARLPSTTASTRRSSAPARCSRRAKIARRRKQKSAARDVASTAALALFEPLGARQLGEQAQRDEARASAASARTDLTPSEGRVAQLVRAGPLQQGVAQARVCDRAHGRGHLSHAYAKLGVRCGPSWRAVAVAAAEV
jgi:hypothetical protein